MQPSRPHTWEAEGRDQGINSPGSGYAWSNSSPEVCTHVQACSLWVRAPSCVVFHVPCVGGIHSEPPSRPATLVLPRESSRAPHAVSLWGSHTPTCKQEGPQRGATCYPRNVPRPCQPALHQGLLRQGGRAGCALFWPARAAGPEQGGHGHDGGRASTNCPRAGERERCASLFYKCTNAPLIKRHK